MGLSKKQQEYIENLAIEKVEVGGELYFDYEGLEKVIAFCEKELIPIIGYEGFKKLPDGIMPDFNAIADFSRINKQAPDYAKQTLIAYRDFIKTVKDHKNMVWTIVI